HVREDRDPPELTAAVGHIGEGEIADSDISRASEVETAASGGDGYSLGARRQHRDRAAPPRQHHIFAWPVERGERIDDCDPAGPIIVEFEVRAVEEYARPLDPGDGAFLDEVGLDPEREAGAGRNAGVQAAR